MERAPPIKARRIAAILATTIALAPWFADAHAKRLSIAPKPSPDWPLEFPGSQYEPVAWSDIPGWSDDDHLAAFGAFRASCAPIALAKPVPTTAGQPADGKALSGALRDPCVAAKSATISDGSAARGFFEQQFQPLRISRLGEPEGFVTGYYEPVLEGSRQRTDVFTVPVYRRPSNLFVRGFNQDSPSLPNKGEVFRKIGRRKLVPYYDRAAIEDGAIAGRGLELCWLKNQTDLLFTQIQGSARIKLDDGSTLRINYEAHNGYPYTPVGRVLIERNIIPKDQMSMQRIRQWMEENPDAANDVRRQNRSYVFFRQVNLSDKDEPLGAQGVRLTPGRSIAVDKSLHVYGTPFFIEGELPIESERSKTPFRRLMVAQDTGSAIVGPARADIYFGAGAEAGLVSGRLRNNARFVILVPKPLDPSEKARTMPLPQDRPSKVIARLFPQIDSAPAAKTDKTVTPGSSTADSKSATPPAGATAANSPAAAVAPAPPAVSTKSTPPSADATVAQAVPLPEARPAAAPAATPLRRHRRFYRR